MFHLNEFADISVLNTICPIASTTYTNRCHITQILLPQKFFFVLHMTDAIIFQYANEFFVNDKNTELL